MLAAQGCIESQAQLRVAETHPRALADGDHRRRRIGLHHGHQVGLVGPWNRLVRVRDGRLGGLALPGAPLAVPQIAVGTLGFGASAGTFALDALGDTRIVYWGKFGRPDLPQEMYVAPFPDGWGYAEK